MGEGDKVNGSFITANAEERNWYLARIEPESSRLLQNEVSQAQMVITLVAGANAGGAVAVLAYISQAAASHVRPIPHSVTVLTLFILGFSLALLLAITTYYSSVHRLRTWTQLTSSFYRGETLWRGLWDGRRLAEALAWLPHVLGWLSVILFLVGAGIGITELLCPAA